MLTAKSFSITKEFEHKGAKFTIGMIDAGTFRQLISKLSLAKRLLVGDIDMTKENLKEAIGKMEENTLIADERMHETFVEFVRLGVRGHEGIVSESGEKIPFIKDDLGTVSEDTLKLYEQNLLIVPLAAEVINFNVLSEKERKN